MARCEEQAKEALPEALKAMSQSQGLLLDTAVGDNQETPAGSPDEAGIPPPRAASPVPGGLPLERLCPPPPLSPEEAADVLICESCAQCAAFEFQPENVAPFHTNRWLFLKPQVSSRSRETPVGGGGGWKKKKVFFF